MKSCIYAVSILLLSGVLYAQNPPQPPGNQGQNQGQNQQTQNAAAIGGFDGINWGATYESVKERFRVLARNTDTKDPVEIIRDTPEKEILIQRRGIKYKYLFYKKPAILQKKDEKQAVDNPQPGETPGANQPANAETPEAPARLFFVSSEFDLVPAEALYEKLQQKYGNRTASTLNKKMRGTYSWSAEQGYLVQWIEPYQNKPYTRNLYYISKEIREEIRKDYEAFMSYRELKALENILP